MLSQHGNDLLIQQIDADWAALEHLCLADHLPGTCIEDELNTIEIERFAQDAVRTAALHEARGCDQVETLKGITPARVITLIGVLRFLDELPDTADEVV